MLRKIVTGLVAAAVVAGTTLAATSGADAKPGYPYWKYHPHPHYYGYNDNGAAVAAGIFGLIGGLMLSEVHHGYGYGYGGYCEARFRTYNPYTHQYMGYDGHPHYCYD